MNSDHSLNKMFDRYLLGKMKHPEQKQFEEKLHSDPEVARLFRLYKEVDASILAEDIAAFRIKLNKIQSDSRIFIPESAPMEVIPRIEHELDGAILEEDVIALREQLDKIHSSYEEELDVTGIPGYKQIDDAIINQNSLKLREELSHDEERSNERHEQGSTERLESDIDKAIMETDIMDLRDKLGKLGSQMLSTTAITVRSGMTRMRIIYSAAALLVLLLASGVFITSFMGPVSSDKAYSKYFDNYTTVSEKRGGVITQDEILLLDKAIRFYNQENYAEAYDLFRYTSKTERLEVMQSMFYAISAMHTNQLQEAETILSGIIRSDEFIYIPDAKWYLALLFIKNEKIDDAMDILRKIAEDPKDKHAKSAQQIIKKGIK